MDKEPKRTGLDAYSTTDEYALAALLYVMGYSKTDRILEPAAGYGDLVRQLLSHGYANVTTNDIAEYGHPLDTVDDYIFPQEESLLTWGEPDAVITNPPYGKQNALFDLFARKSLERYPNAHIALLCDATWDMGKTRLDLTGGNSRYVGKIALVSRLKWFDDRAGTKWHAWYVWGPTNPEKEKEAASYPSIAYVSREHVKGLQK